MGSRKKKVKQLKSNFNITYRSLSVNQRIALKQFFFCWGRNRSSLKEMLSNNYFLNMSTDYIYNCIESGYTWL